MDELVGVLVQRYLGGSGNLNYSLKNINKALIVPLRDHVCSFSAKQKEMGFVMYTLCPSICCKPRPPNRCIIIGALSRTIL